MVKELITKEEAVKRGYLENKKIVVKPSPRVGLMGITAPEHIAFFQHDQCSTFFSLPRTSRGDLVNVFKDEEERLYFENELGANLNPFKPGNLFESMLVKITMDRQLLKDGESFDMSNPTDNLRLRIIRANSDKVAPSWDDRKKKNTYRWALVDESQIGKEAEVEFDSKIEFGMLMGKYAATTPDMRDLLKIYYGSISSNKTISNEDPKNVLMKELNTISEDKNARNKLLSIVEDKTFPIKKTVLQAINAGIIKKTDVDTYVFVGDEATFTFNEITKTIHNWKNEDDDEYFKLVARIEEFNKKQ